MVDPSRRKVLSMLGTGGLAMASLSASAAARGQGRGRETLPNPNAPSSKVYPFGCENPYDKSTCNVQEVSPGDWIVHRVYWITSGNECGKPRERQRELLRKFLDNADTRAWIRGEEVKDAHQYYSQPYYEDQFDQMAIQWKFVTPPKRKGTTHLFKMQHIYENEMVVGWDPDSCEVDNRGPGEGDPVAGAYRVV